MGTLAKKMSSFVQGLVLEFGYGMAVTSKCVFGEIKDRVFGGIKDCVFVRLDVAFIRMHVCLHVVCVCLHVVFVFSCCVCVCVFA